jgi:hypothetical protein
MRIFLLLFLFLAVQPGKAQSLRDSLFGGKMKVDSALLQKSKGNVQKAEAETETDKKSTPETAKKLPVDSVTKSEGVGKPEITFADNPKIWKKHMDQLTTTLNAEVLSSKKVKKGTYTVMIDYDIETNGAVSIKKLTTLPENDYLTEQVSERLAASTPQLAPLVRDGVARKSSRRYNLILTKDKN